MKAAPLEEYEKLGTGALAKAVLEGDMEYGSIMAGQIAAIVNKEQSCKEIITEMMKEADELLNRSWR
jgi:enoyl-[acyl-carrier protein] reductase II